MACPGLLRTHHPPPLPTAATVPGGRGLSRPRAKRAPAPPVAALTDRGPSRRESPPWAMAEACAERESQRPGLVIAGRDPAIQSAAAALDGRVEPGHDERGDGRSTPASVVAFRRSPLPPGAAPRGVSGFAACGRGRWGGGGRAVPAASGTNSARIRSAEARRVAGGGRGGRTAHRAASARLA